MSKSILTSIFCIIALSVLAQDSSFNVMTYNIRLPVPDDGINYWDNRRPLVVSMIRFHEIDLLGVQEAFRRQLDEMVADMPEYDWFGVCRTDGFVQPNPDGEFSAIMYRKDRFERLDGKTFWLSQTPEKAGSKGWDAALPRIVTWAKFKDRRTGQVFFHFNTHFDHMGQIARVESAKLLLHRIEDIAGDMPVVVTGDFNSTDDSEPYRILTDTSKVYHLTDAMRISAAPHYGPLGTFSGNFQLPGVGTNRIDFVFIRNRVDVLRHAILSDSWDGRLASDHLGVMAEVRVKN